MNQGQARGSDGAAVALERLDAITRRLRRECPWDREQDERSIVPHTVEEAYELADAALAGDDEKILDELGDVLFQVVFLSLLLEERGAGDLARVAEHCRQKLIRRHPHVFGEVPGEERSRGAGPASTAPPSSAEEVLRNWDAIKADTEGGGPFGDLPDVLPAATYAKKAQRRAGRVGGADAEPPGVSESLTALEAATGRDECFQAAGELLFAAVARASGVEADPELALRVAADRYIARIQEGLETK